MKGGCQLGIKVVPHDTKSNLALSDDIFYHGFKANITSLGICSNLCCYVRDYFLLAVLVKVCEGLNMKHGGKMVEDRFLGIVHQHFSNALYCLKLISNHFGVLL